MPTGFNPSRQLTTPETHSRTAYPFVKTPTELAFPVSILDGVGIVIGATTNMLVMVMIRRNHHRLQNMDLFIFNLCFSDFLSSLLYQPVVIFRLMLDSPITDIESKLLGMTGFTFLIAGVSSLFLVTLDRYLSVRLPFRYALFVNKTKVLLSIGFAWFVGLLTGAISVAGMPAIAGYMYGTSIATLFFLTVTFQILAFRIARKRENDAKKLQLSLCYNYHSSDTRVKQNFSASQIHKSHVEIKATKTVIVLFLVFTLSWLPQVTLNVYHMTRNDPKTFLTYIYIFNALLQVHACMNPFIYVFRTRRVRETIFAASYLPRRAKDPVTTGV